jgi:hypothetical protein
MVYKECGIAPRGMQPVTTTFVHNLFTENSHGKSSLKKILRKTPFIAMVTGLLRWASCARNEF